MNNRIFEFNPSVADRLCIPDRVILIFDVVLSNKEYSGEYKYRFYNKTDVDLKTPEQKIHQMKSGAENVTVMRKCTCTKTFLHFTASTVMGFALQL